VSVLNRRYDPVRTDGIADLWRRACLGAGVGLQVDTVTGPTDVIPYVVAVAGPYQFTVALPPGLIPDDIRRAATRLAPAMGAAMLRVTERGPLTVIITLLAVDPLAVLNETVPGPIASVHEPVTLGISEDGARGAAYLTDGAHWVLQGSSGSGKSIMCYGLLGQLVDAPDVLVAGSDISGLLLSPWAQHPRHAGWQACGTRTLAEHVEVLERLTAVMDQRIQELPYGEDQVRVDAATPAVLCVLEEWPGCQRVLGTVKAARGEPSLVDRARGAVGRIMAEGRKAAFTALIIAQRADAAAIGAFERGQASHTMSFRVDNSAAVHMLHSDVPPEVVAAHASALPGVALFSAPGCPLIRFRAPRTDYRSYCTTVAEAASRAATRLEVVA